MTHSELQNRIGLPSFYCYDNHSKYTSSTCGPAVIASIIDYAGKNPYTLERTQLSPIDHKYHFEKDRIVEAVLDQFGYDWPAFKGMSPRSVLLKAFQTIGVPYKESFARPFSNPNRSEEILISHLSTNRPAVVLFRVAPLGLGKPFTLHWSIAYAADRDFLYLATWERTLKVEWEKFLQAWNVWYLPYPYTYYQILIDV